ncbi:hypothetical protein BSKO_03095 [Bryopsis sp. KO-2023]|nr:hypothetical protein BSKO_03095 [Bryopsis sp. KO-2023]
MQVRGCSPGWPALCYSLEWRSNLLFIANSAQCRRTNASFSRVAGPQIHPGRLKAHNGGDPPWTMSWQLNERHTEWSDTNKGRLVATMASENFDSPEIFDKKMEQLCSVVPGIHKSLHRMQPEMLISILANLEEATDVMLVLRERFGPLDVDISRVVCAHPEALTWSKLHAKITLNRLVELFGTLEAVALILKVDPWILDIKRITAALNDLQRILNISREEAVRRVVNETGILATTERCDVSLGDSDCFDQDTQSWRD